MTKKMQGVAKPQAATAKKGPLGRVPQAPKKKKGKKKGKNKGNLQFM